MRTRLIALLSSALIVASACATTASPSPPAATAGAQPSGTPTAAKQVLKVWTRNYTVQDPAVAGSGPSPFFAARDKFQAAHPDVTVELSGVPYDPQYQRLLLSQNGSIADKPDVFLMDNIWLGQFSENGLAANLDSYYASWAGASDISDAYVASSKWNGSQYGVWAYSDIRLFIWNKDVFRKAGLDPEKAPATWQDVLDDAAAIKAKVPGVSPVGFPAGSFEATVDRFYAYLFMTGSNILDPTNKHAVFNDAGGQKAVQFLVELVKKGYASQDVLGLDADPVVSSVYAGKFGMMLATVGDASAARPAGMTSDQFKAKIGAALPPLCDGCTQATAAGGWMLGIGKDSTKKDLAWEYIMDVTDGANMVPFDVFFVRVPVRKSGLAQADAFKADPYFAESAKAITVAHFPPFVASYTAMIEPIWTAIQSSIQGTPVKESLDQAAKDVDKILNPTP
jgi:multiple sugar transport system substrate-binding protein